MDVLEAIGTRRSVREFADRPLPDDVLRAILDAGRRAGSSKNSQRWAFVVVSEEATLQALSNAGRWAGHIAGAAVAVALVTPNPRGSDQPLSVMWDLGGAAAQMMLAGWALGVGSCPATMYEDEVVRQILGLPDELHCEYVLSFGYPKDERVLQAPNRAGGRKPLDDLVHEERW